MTLKWTWENKKLKIGKKYLKEQEDMICFNNIKMYFKATTTVQHGTGSRISQCQ